MRRNLTIEVAPQPDNVTCGPTCLHGIYRYYGVDLPLSQVIAETHMLDGGGTLDVFLANHALKRGYAATIFTYNLAVFDPTWFAHGEQFIAERLTLQARKKRSKRLLTATRGYLEFLERGGHLLFEDLTPALIRRYLNRASPILAGLSATYLYRSVRERPSDCKDDDVAGEPLGHFVVLAGYDRERRQVRVADPYHANPLAPGGEYSVDIRRLVGAVFLGVATYDGSLLVIENAKGPAGG